MWRALRNTSAPPTKRMASAVKPKKLKRNWPSSAQVIMAMAAVRLAFRAQERSSRFSMPEVAPAKTMAELGGLMMENSEVATPKAKARVGAGPRCIWIYASRMRDAEQFRAQHQKRLSWMPWLYFT